MVGIWEFGEDFEVGFLRGRNF